MAIAIQLKALSLCFVFTIKCIYNIRGARSETDNERILRDLQIEFNGFRVDLSRPFKMFNPKKFCF